MKYICYAGKAGQTVNTFEVDNNDSNILKLLLDNRFTKISGIRLVERIDDDNRKYIVFEDWDNPLNPDHPVFHT
ncbi:MAG: hypothetical protein G01um101429_283 [Parcubacteria group bacterium Gr01-1014_29]|nr:MAG: hypothetical protein G01um101429_283 [Parcubacteria group bacterium Gr01-1014_29]